MGDGNPNNSVKVRSHDAETAAATATFSCRNNWIPFLPNGVVQTVQQWQQLGP